MSDVAKLFDMSDYSDSELEYLFAALNDDPLLSWMAAQANKENHAKEDSSRTPVV